MSSLNILQLLRPKAMTAYISDGATLRQAAEIMRRHGYTAVPVINKAGEYVKTMAEGDFLWFMLENGVKDITGLEAYMVGDVPKRVMCEPVSVDSTIEDLFMLSMNQNFVPVVDGRGVFIGIVTRRDILQACYAELKNSEMFSAQPEYELEEGKA
ncbi:CBS domain-containing protein [Ruminococcus sp. YE71]|uniref:CBS domain-containing protein n=1 Tax=unclassified Ruminococcus TaxID=2608920 RepID=UPI0008926825|nr:MULTISPECIES: CBS domain-containing protein [unclassified Ruminococcus]SDA14434.1 CBS domain-containing protein [Ruminococcus sp. YE78]SFW21019.1 CBS domain-containing protein [Ruminococcus sp. YE71]